MIRQASVRDLERLYEIFSYAKKFMRENNNPKQWSGDYPGKKFLDEINQGIVYVLEDRGYIYGVFLLNIGTDPSYSYIEGAWLKDETPYGTIHRVASDGSRRGVFKEIVDFSLEKINQLRIDTHEDNHIMQGAILSMDFKYCGIIYLENGDKRLAYQLVK
ncbi:MAG: N-acetyltransferase [Tissierellia bacterium]|nr:N-acetyltransferase [Tissierellia bacterium]